MLSVGRVEKYLVEKIAEKGAIHLTLLDPEKMGAEEAARVAEIAQEAGSSGIMVGGSIGVSEVMVDDVVSEIKKRVELPVILFPGDVSGVSRFADALWFLSVLNSSSPYYFVGAQMRGAPIVKGYGIEAIPLAYLILGKGGTVGYVSEARLIPFSKPEIACAYALAAQFMGFRFVYLEGGSGGDPVPQGLISKVVEAVDIPVVVGGGIKNEELAKRAVSAGAEVLVVSTALEEAGDVWEGLREIIQGMEEGVGIRRVSSKEPKGSC